ncbi:MAG: response regulator transcription factor [Microthrixaceae bacterium]
MGTSASEVERSSNGLSGAHVLVGDDDRAIRDSVARLLELKGYSAATVSNGAEVLESLRQRPADLLVLDLMMPGVDGLSVCRVLRSEGSRIPILMLTARTQTSDRVAGLDAGADDYLPKPFDPEELLARVRALLRRTGDQEGGGSDEVLTVGDLRVDPAARRVWRADSEIELSKTEFDLLEYLAANSGIVLDRTAIYDHIWGYDFGPQSKNLAVYVGYLRRKIDDGAETKLIHTVRGVGYTLRVGD